MGGGGVVHYLPRLALYGPIASKMKVKSKRRTDGRVETTTDSEMLSRSVRKCPPLETLHLYVLYLVLRDTRLHFPAGSLI